LRIFLPIAAHVITAFFSAIWNRRKESSQVRKLYFWLMISGFIWSQLQTEYLIWRVNQKTEQESDSFYSTMKK